MSSEENVTKWDEKKRQQQKKITEKYETTRTRQENLHEHEY